MAEKDPEYPAEILPKEVYKKNLDPIDWGKGDYYIQRGCSQEYSGRGIGRLSPGAFGENVVGMSVNILGAYFDTSHVFWTPKGNPQIWNGVDCMEKYEAEYEYDSTRGGIYIKISDIDGKTFPSPRKFDKNAAFEKVKAALTDSFDKFSSDAEYVVRYRINARHVPTIANYWHYQVEIAPDMEPSEELKKNKSGWQKEVFRRLVNFILPYAASIVPEHIETIDKSVFVK